MHLEDLLAAQDIRVRHDDLAVEAAGPQQRRVKHIGTVGGGDQDDPSFASKPSISTSSWFRVCSRSSLPPPRPAPRCRPTASISSMKMMQGAFFLALFEHVAHAAGADADEHLDEIRAGDGEERHIRLAGDGSGQQRLTGTRRADQQTALGDLAAEALELLWVLEELDDFLELGLGLVDARDIVEGDASGPSRSAAGPCVLPKPMALPPPPCIWRMKKIHTPMNNSIGNQEIKIPNRDGTLSSLGAAVILTPVPDSVSTSLGSFGA